MKTSDGILTMPSIYVADSFSGENVYVFFPVSALLSEEEQAFFELYKCNVNPNEDSMAIEREIMSLL